MPTACCWKPWRSMTRSFSASTSTLLPSESRKAAHGGAADRQSPHRPRGPRHDDRGLQRDGSRGARRGRGTGRGRLRGRSGGSALGEAAGYRHRAGIGRAHRPAAVRRGILAVGRRHGGSHRARGQRGIRTAGRAAAAAQRERYSRSRSIRICGPRIVPRRAASPAPRETCCGCEANLEIEFI